MWKLRKSLSPVCMLSNIITPQNQVKYFLYKTFFGCTPVPPTSENQVKFGVKMRHQQALLSQLILSVYAQEEGGGWVKGWRRWGCSQHWLTPVCAASCWRATARL